MKPTHKIFALLSAQGTACEETVLLESEYTEANRRVIEAHFCSPRVHHDPPIAGTWTDVSDNESFWPSEADDA